MSLLSERKFTFTWQIQNFSMHPSKFKEPMDSPVFTVESMENSEWQMQTYFKGDRTENFLACYLYCKSVAGKSDGFKIHFSFTIISGVKKVTIKTSDFRAFKKGDGFGFSNCISREVIFGDKEAYLPNDTLTIKCSMRGSDDNDLKQNSSSAEPKNSKLSHSTALDNNYESGQSDECSVVTRVEVRKRNVFWSLPNFSSIGFNKRLIIRVSSALKDHPSFFITFYKSVTNHSAEIEIGCTKIDSSKSLFVKCKISVLHTPKGYEISAEDEHLFDSNIDHIWKFPSFMTLNKLEEDANLEGTCDILHLLIEFSFSMLGDVHHMEKIFSNQYGALTNLPNPIKEFRDMYKGEELSDVTIRASGREFKVHKIILKARSPVFGAMFDNDMKEKKTGVVDITDVDPDTVDKMLAFMYTNVIGEIEAEDALKLYASADKYEVQPLKFQCSSVLASKLSESNVCQVLTLADQHNDEYLRDCAQNFVRMNYTGVLKSAEWEDLMKNNSVVASKIMFKILTI